MAQNRLIPLALCLGPSLLTWHKYLYEPGCRTKINGIFSMLFWSISEIPGGDYLEATYTRLGLRAARPVDGTGLKKNGRHIRPTGVTQAMTATRSSPSRFAYAPELHRLLSRGTLNCTENCDRQIANTKISTHARLPRLSELPAPFYAAHPKVPTHVYWDPSTRRRPGTGIPVDGSTRAVPHELDEFREWWNQHRVRLQRDKNRPSGHIPAHAHERPTYFGEIDFCIRVPKEAIAELRKYLTEEVRSRETHLGVAPEFKATVRRAWAGIGSSEMTIESAWNIFAQLWRITSSDKFCLLNFPLFNHAYT
ncbi:hypothetical protein DFH09DRAFT_1076052 [Mycena vulgaris]|nr:hypothetical protein DFH09DRAFT_1076052 [Mycena vulgaris]